MNVHVKCLKSVKEATTTTAMAETIDGGESNRQKKPKRFARNVRRVL